MKILLLCSAFNGLSQRAWIELRGDGHEVTVEIAVDEEAIRRAVAVAEPDLVICPFLRERVPADVLTHRRTIIVHPGTQRRPGTFLIGLGDHRRRTSLGGHRPAGGGGDGCRARLVITVIFDRAEPAGTIAYPALSPPRDAAVDVTIGEFVERVAFDDSGSLEGVPVRLSGFVVGIDGRDDAFLLTRFVIACGAADAFPVQAIVNTTDVPPNDTWLEVVGTWVSDDLGLGAAGRSATIEAQLTRLIARPENPYDR